MAHDDVAPLRWNITLDQVAPLPAQQRLAVERLRAVADQLEQIPAEVFAQFWKTPGKRTGGMCGAPSFGYPGALNPSDPWTGWKGIWSVGEIED